MFKTPATHAINFADAVLNHKAGADFPEKFHAIEVDSEDRTKELTEPVGFFFSPIDSPSLNASAFAVRD